MRVLLLESECNYQKLISEYLKYYGINVTAVSTIKEAKRLAENDAFNTVLTEYFLPDGKGTELIYYLKELWPEMKVIGISNEDNGKAFYNAGADHYMEKPLKFKELLQIIQPG